MPRIEHIIAALIILFVITVFVRHASQTDADKEARKLRPSWAVRTLNAATGANLDSRRLLPAVTELAGRGITAAASRTREAVSTRIADGRAQRSAGREGRDERIADLVDRAQAAAVQRGRAVVDAVGRHWPARGDRDSEDGRQGAADDPVEGGEQPGQTADQPEAKPRRWRLLRRFRWWRDRDGSRTEPLPASPPAPAGDDDPVLLGRADCPKCGARVKGVVGSAEQDCTVTCGGCGHRITFYRAPNDPPDEAEQDSTSEPQSAATNTQEEHVTSTDERQFPGAAMPDTTVSAPQIPMPIDWRPIAQRVADLKPDSDAELINFMSGEIAGMCAYARSYEELFETCTKSLGLDQRSVAGLGEFGDRIVSVTREMAMAHKRFVAFYEEVMRFVGEGGVMPHDGRFFTGNVQV